MMIDNNKIIIIITEIIVVEIEDNMIEIMTEMMDKEIIIIIEDNKIEITLEIEEINSNNKGILIVFMLGI